MLRMLEAQAPAKQTATDTINTLSSRLVNATLLEDRRAAILGLRSFAKEYPASVASGALRGLISSLTNDRDDVDTGKVILETLLMLFSPDETSPEASDDIALWLADEFTQRQDNITTLLDLLESPDFYPRLYALQLINAISSARPERTQECILSAPLGTTRLVDTLDDPRDAIRNAGLVLLSELTQASPELQKLVAFENAFDRIFRLVEAEGSLTQGGIVVQDCLSLLANLIRHNASNQNLFRETGCVSKLSEMLPGGPRKKASQIPDEDEGWVSPQRDKNIWGALAVVRMFLGKGSTGTAQNQNAFQKHGLLQQILNLAFERSTPIPLKAEALNTCADMIRGNARLQEGFAQLQVTAAIDASAATNGDSATNGVSKAYVIDALLDLALSAASSHIFDARFAACECVKAYCYSHMQIRTHFLHRAIDGHQSGQDETANALSILIHGPQSSGTVDPYRSWFAAVLIFHLVYDDPEAKSILMTVSEGDAESGEEVVTCIQAIAGNLIAGMQRDEDERVSIGHLMLLCGWLFEDAAGVNDFLGEGSVVQSLVQAASRPGTDREVVRGLCAVLLGILYEFSTKDSPIPRRTLQPVLVSSLGRERYLEAITQLRQHPLVRDFEVLPQGGAAAAAAPGAPLDVFFDATFVEFLKDNFSRLSRAIDRDPAFEVLPASAAQGAGIDRDLVDTLRTQLDERVEAVQKLEAELVTLERKLNQEQAEHRRSHETGLAEVNRIKSVNEGLQRNHDADVQRMEQDQRATLQQVEEKHRQEIQSVQAQLQRVQREADEQAEQARVQAEQDIASLRDAHASLEARLAQAQEMHVAAENRVTELESSLSSARSELETSQHELDTSRNELGSSRQSNTDLEEQLRQSRARVDKLVATQKQLSEGTRRINAEIQQLSAKFADREARLKKADARIKEKEQEVEEKEEERGRVQQELDDMLMVLADLEEKRARDRKRLKVLGEEISDADDEDEEEGEEDEDENEEGVEEGEDGLNDNSDEAADGEEAVDGEEGEVEESTGAEDGQLNGHNEERDVGEEHGDEDGEADQDDAGPDNAVEEEEAGVLSDDVD